MSPGSGENDVRIERCDQRYAMLPKRFAMLQVVEVWNLCREAKSALGGGLN